MARNRSKRRDDDDDEPEVPKTRSDAYVGLLAISLIALIAGIVLLYVDFDEISQGAAPLPSVTTSTDGLGLPKAAPKS